MFQIGKLEDLLLVIDESKSLYLCIKGFDRFMFHKTKNKNKNYICKSCLQCLSSKNLSTKHKKVCLSINGAQSVRLEKVTIEFENYLKQIPVPFKIYADFECNLTGAESYEGFYSKNIKITFLVVLLTNLFVLMMNLLSQYPAGKYWSLGRIEDVPSNVLGASPKDPI